MKTKVFATLTLVVLGGIVLAHTIVASQAKPDSGPLEATDSTGKKYTYKEPKVQKGDLAIIETNLGTIKMEFLADKAPGHVANFEKLAEAGFFDGSKFHRVIPGFMIQGGDPNSKGEDRSQMGTGGPGYSINAEFNDTKFERGVVGMARSSDPNSAGSQFFIMVATASSLNNQYTAFAKVTEGMDVADKIVNLPRDDQDNPKAANPAIIKSVKIVHPAK